MRPLLSESADTCSCPGVHDMPAHRFDVLAIGNAIVDVLARSEEDALVRLDIPKGAMNLIDEARAEHLYAQMGPARIASGGSAGNTIAGLASFGGKGAYIGKLRNDELGKLFRHDMRALGVAFGTADATSGPATARSFIFVTPDSERTMNTYLGACTRLTAADIDADTVQASQITYLEGYLWDPPEAKDAFRKAADLAHAGGRRVALTLSDSFCVDRYRAEFLNLMTSGAVDLIFANESELKSLYQTADFDTAVTHLQAMGTASAVTRSEKGAIYVSRDGVVEEGAFPIGTLVDTTGAGDLFAAGFLFGLTTNREARDCLRLGALAAAEVIQEIGPRPARNLKDLAAQNGLI
jgi:sugar/nucleoside kinase (ribokinase family)